MALPYATENQLKILEQKTKAELDKKTANINLTANTLEDMNALIATGAVNDGQLCYLKEDKKLYVLKDGKWEEVGGGGSELPEMIVTISTEGEVSIDMGNLQPNNYTITLNYAGALIKHSGFGAIAYMGSLDTPMKMFSGFFNLGGIYQIIQAFNTNVCTGGKALIAEGVEPNSLVMFNDNYNVETFTNPNADGDYYLGFNRDYDDSPNWKEINSKTISLFGKHSILVPKDSADTAIDFYIHNIVLKDTANTPTKKIYLTIQSTTNTPATTKELLQTLLGSTARYIRVSGYTPTNDISAINWTGTFDTSKYDVRGTETSLTDFTVIEDSVVTL